MRLKDASELTGSQVLLEKVRVAVQKRVGRAMMIRIEAFNDVFLEDLVIDMVGEMVGEHDRDPIVLDHYHEPATWWDALKLAWNRRVGRENEAFPGWPRELRLHPKFRMLPRTYQELRVCPHLDLPSPGPHVRWITTRRPIVEMAARSREADSDRG